MVPYTKAYHTIPYHTLPYHSLLYRILLCSKQRRFCTLNSKYGHNASNLDQRALGPMLSVNWLHSHHVNKPKKKQNKTKHKLRRKVDNSFFCYRTIFLIQFVVNEMSMYQWYSLRLQYIRVKY